MLQQVTQWSERPERLHPEQPVQRIVWKTVRSRTDNGLPLAVHSLFSYMSKGGHNWSSQALTSMHAKEVLPKNGTRPAALFGKA